METHSETRIVQGYLAYLKKTPAEKEAIKTAWALYYEACEKTLAKENFSAQREAYKQGKMHEVKERGLWARDLRIQNDFVMKPRIFPYDPDEFEYSQLVLTYRGILRDIERESYKEIASTTYSDF